MNPAGLAPIELSAVDRQEMLASMAWFESQATVIAAPNSDAELGTITDFVRTVGAFVKRMEKVRQAEKEPFLAGGREVDAFFKVIAERAMTIDKQIDKIVTPYLRHKANEMRAARPQSE
jgi:hypothetical protein